MTLAERLSEFVRACFTGLWIRTFEHDDALAEIARLCRQQHWSLATWDIDRGLNLAGRRLTRVPLRRDYRPAGGHPVARGLGTPDGTALLVLRNFHQFLNSAEVVQALDTQLAAGKQARTFVVVLAPVVQIPVELERQFVVLEHDLPGRDQLERSPAASPPSPASCPRATA